MAAKIRRIVETKLPTKHGDFLLYGFSDSDKRFHVALVKGKISKKPTFVRVHSECLTGDVFGSCRCDCGSQLHKAMELIAKKGGVLLYLRQEGRGIGLYNKLRAYQLQDKGLDTVEANIKLGFKPDARNYTIAALILKSLGLKKIRLLTNNPKKITGLEKLGFDIVERISIQIPSNKVNKKYLEAKRLKLGHLLDAESRGGISEKENNKNAKLHDGCQC